MSDLDKMMKKLKDKKDDKKTKEKAQEKDPKEDENEDDQDDEDEEEEEQNKIPTETEISNEVALLQNDGVFRRELIITLKNLINVQKVTAQATINLNKLIGEITDDKKD